MRRLARCGVLILALGAVAAAHSPARGCGAGAEFAAAYLNADRAVEGADARFRCKFTMLANMMCAGRGRLAEPRNRRFVVLALAEAWNSPDARLRCAAGIVHGEAMGGGSVEELTQRPPLAAGVRKALDGLIKTYGQWCAGPPPLGDRPDYSDLPLTGDGQKLRECLSK